MTRIENPAWDYISRVPNDDLLADFQGRPQKAMSSLTLRDGFSAKEEIVFYRDWVTRLYTWAIPSPDAIDFVVEMTQGQGVVEIGAGNGYWAWMLSQHGVDVNAYDSAPIGHEGTWFYRRADPGTRDPEPVEFYPVQKASVEALDLPENHDRVLFLCWPTMDPWAWEAVRRFKGDRIIYIGEGGGGCTADSAFHKAVSGECGCWSVDDGHEPACMETEQLFEETGSSSIVQWMGIRDHILVYDRIVTEREISAAKASILGEPEDEDVA